MLTSSWRLLRESTAIFMETSGDIDPASVAKALASEPDVVGVHDLHVWTVTSGFPAVSAHVLVGHGADCHAARARLERVLAERFGLSHSTLQVEHAPPGLVRTELPMVRR
jgi:cobalt-zinc-cadmium efflux system protein